MVAINEASPSDIRYWMSDHNKLRQVMRYTSKAIRETKLTEVEHRIITLHFVEGMTHKEIAKVVEIDERNVSKTLNRSIRRIAVQMLVD